MKITSVLVSQPRPAAVEKSPFYEVSQKCELEIEYSPLIKVEGVSLKEFRSQRIEVLDHTALIFTSRTTVDSFFKVCEQARITVPETMKYPLQGGVHAGEGGLPLRPPYIHTPSPTHYTETHTSPTETVRPSPAMSLHLS